MKGCNLFRPALYRFFDQDATLSTDNDNRLAVIGIYGNTNVELPGYLGLLADEYFPDGQSFDL